MSKRNHKPDYELFEGELPDIYEQLKRDFDEGLEEWLDAPNERFNMRTPRELIGTKDEIKLRNLLRRVRYGLFT